MAPEIAVPAEVPITTWIPAYLAVREREGRLFPDALVEALPGMPAGHPLAGEWRQRADSATRLLAHLGRRPGPLRVVDLGSGNGWLAARMAGLHGSEVVGIEANDVELAQSQRVFADRPGLRFEAGDLLSVAPPLAEPNVVVLASVTQYVADLRSLLARLLGWLAADGELHVLDSPFYQPEEVASAQDRTRRYYASLGVPEMADGYHHHAWPALDGLGATIRYRPDAIRPRVENRLLGRSRSPFPWIVLRPGAR